MDNAPTSRAADKELDLAQETEDLVYFCDEVIKHAEYVLSQTPEMLPVLKQAGVVDSGGQGLVQVLKGAYDSLLGKEIDYSIEETPASTGTAKVSEPAEQEIKYGSSRILSILIFVREPWVSAF